MTTGKRVLIVCETYPPRMWGQELAAQRLARGLVALGLQVEVVTKDYQEGTPPKGAGPTPWQTVTEPDGIVVTRIRLTERVLHFSWLEAALRARGPADAVIAFAIGTYATAAVSMAGRWGVPSILWARGRDAMFDLFDWERAAEVMTVVRDASRVLAVTAEMARLLQPFHPHGPVLAWPNVVDQSRFFPRPDRRALRQRFGLPPDRLLAGFSGHLRASKGIDELLGALSCLRGQGQDAGLVIVGGVSDRAAPAVDAWKKAHPQDVPYLHAVPFVEPAVLPDVLGCLDQAWYPVIFDGFSNSLLETVACGIPTIATAIGGNPEIVRHGETGYLIPVGDPEALAAASVRMAADLVATEAMAAQALAELPARHHPRLEQERLRALMQTCGLLPA
jgi:glycosyltransferase involved in cell wall biosynthesis